MELFGTCVGAFEKLFGICLDSFGEVWGGRKAYSKPGQKHAKTLQNVSSWGRSNGLRFGGVKRSVITGAKGNVEFFINFQK